MLKLILVGIINHSFLKLHIILILISFIQITQHLYSKLLPRLQNERLHQTVMKRVSCKELKLNPRTCSNQGTWKHSKTRKHKFSSMLGLKWNFCRSLFVF